MAAVRCAVRRLGGSLLQRTQAAVAGEGHRLVPSRPMRFREPTQAAVAEELRRRLPSRFVRSHKLPSEHAPKIPKEEELFEKQYQQSWADLRKAIHEMAEYRRKTRPTEFQLRVKSIGDAAKSVMVGSAKLTIYCMVAAAAFDGDGVEA